MVRLFCIQLVAALSISVAQSTPVSAQVSENVSVSKKALVLLKETRGQRNARLEAASYLKYYSFSRKGLIDQLLYEGYTRKEATYGVDVAKTNWSHQAVKTARSYLKYSSFSRKSLIDQLLYEGYTRHQATYGVDVTKTNWSHQAVKTARSYLKYSTFSRKGLYAQLIYEGFTPHQAAFGVNKAYK